jgi:hypothetical protein
MCDELAGRFVLCVASAPDVVATLCRAECSHVLWTFCGRSVDVRSLVGQRQFGHVTMRIETAQDLRVRLPRRSLRHETQSGEGRTRSLRAESTRTPSPTRADAGNLSGTQEGECNGARQQQDQEHCDTFVTNPAVASADGKATSDDFNCDANVGTHVPGSANGDDRAGPAKPISNDPGDCNKNRRNRTTQEICALCSFSSGVLASPSSSTTEKRPHQ